MMRAVCLTCGAIKEDAFVPCPKCGHHPQTDEDKARHLILTEWYFSMPKLEYFSQKVKSGEALDFNPATLARFIGYIRAGQLPQE